LWFKSHRRREWEEKAQDSTLLRRIVKNVKNFSKQTGAQSITDTLGFVPVSAGSKVGTDQKFATACTAERNTKFSSVTSIEQNKEELIKVTSVARSVATITERSLKQVELGMKMVISVKPLQTIQLFWQELLKEVGITLSGSIDLSWKNILEGFLNPLKTSITKMGSEMITGLKILNSGLKVNPQVSVKMICIKRLNDSIMLLKSYSLN